MAGFGHLVFAKEFQGLDQPLDRDYG